MKRPGRLRALTGMPFGWVGRTAALAARDGFDVREALATAGVTHGDDLVRDDTLLGPAEFLLLCALLINALDDEMHGAGVTPMVRGTASMIAKAVAGERNLAGVVHTVSRFLDMMGSACRINLDYSGDLASVQIAVDGDPALTIVIEELMAHFLQHQFSFFLGFPLPLWTFTTRGADHPALGGVHPYLLCPVTLGSVTALSFPARHLRDLSHIRIETAPLWDAQMFWLSHLCPTEVEAIDATAQPASAAILDHLSRDNLMFEACCAQRCVTPHELKRTLALEGTSFRKLRRAALIDRARPYLVAGATADDLADMLGYSDARSLRRALKLATGLSLGELRRERLGGSAKPNVFGTLRQQAMLMA